MDSSRIEKEMAAVTAFLDALGLTRREDVNTEAYWQDVHDDIGRAIGRPLNDWELSDPMSETVVDLFFSTPGIARKFLTVDLPRLTQLLVTLETLGGFPKNLKTVAEIGGGPGIVSLWLAKKNPEARFTVYDQSENALAVGRSWARDLGVTNVHYQRAVYRDLGTETPELPFDLVLGLGALNLQLVLPEPHLCADVDPAGLDTPVTRGAMEFAKACRNLLTSSGVLYFSQGSFNDLGLLGLFHAFRENGLGLDWRHTYAVGEGDGAGFSLKAIHLFLTPGQRSVFSDAREDLRVFLFSSKMARFADKTVLGHGDFESWLGLLSGGTKLADIRASQDDGRIERFTVYVKSGILGFFSSHSGGLRSGFIHNAASFESTVERLMAIVANYKQRGVTLTRCDWHPYFKEHTAS